MLTIKRQHTRIYSLLLTLLLLGGMVNEAWAYKVTYHVLTLEIDADAAHMVDAVDGKRLEAVRAIVDNATSIELPAHFKSPLATNFKYYAADQVEASAVTELHSGSNRVKGIIYNLKVGAEETAEGAAVNANMDIYVTYEYNAAENTIVKLDGTGKYIIGVKKGFLALNRGRNNRPAVVPKSMVSDAQLISEDFVKVNVDGSGITTYWSSGDNKNPQASVGSQFHFLFTLEGNDPYNIIIRTAYAKDSTYMEKEANNKKHYKYYKESSLFAPSTNNCYLASDEHREYNIDYVNNTPFAEYPRNLTKGDGTGWIDTPGFFHGQGAPIWSTFALLNNTTGDGYVFMGSRTYKSNGDFESVGGSYPNYQYKYLKFDNANLTINNQTPANATTNYSTDQYFYEIKTITFNVKTPFGNKVSADVKMSEYKILNDDIIMSDIPTSLERKYCTFRGFYKDADLTQEITKYSELEGSTNIYLKYEVSATIPFKAIKPAATYSDATWKAATWYELTDGGSTEENGKKLKYDGSSTFKNNGAHNKFTKTSEYAFIGDPYELQVVLRSETSGDIPSYVGAASEGNLGISTSGGDGYHWEIEDDNTEGSFLLRKFKGTGYWSWDAGHRSENISYTTPAHSVSLTYGNAQTVTFNISNLTYADGNYIKVTKGETDADQVISTTPTLTSGIGSVASDGTATVTATIAANSSGSKTFTLTITEYNKSNTKVGKETVITVTQGYAAYTGNTVQYGTSSSTRVKVLELSNAKYTYHIVDKSGRIAVKATTTQPIYSPLSIASIPSIIVSPFILDETVKFYDDSYEDGTGRSMLTQEITETPDVDNPEVGANIYVTYTTTHLKDKPFRLSEDQEIFVKLNGQYVYYDGGTLKSSAEKGDSDTYKWKLRNRDPYAMLLDNVGARSTSGNEPVTVYADDGSTTTAEREVGAWVKLATTVGDGVALAFDTDRDNAQPFIAKSSARAGVYEVMVATGNGVDASTTYYNIGRPDAETVKIYSNATYQVSDDEEIKFVLEENETYTYHLIDKSKHELLTVDSRSPELVLPAEYQSPLVGTANYSYYGIDQFNVSGEGANAVYTLKGSPTKLTNISGLLATYHYTTTSSDATNSWTEASTVDDMESDVKKLKVAGHYYYKVVDTYYDVEVTKPYYTDIYVTYEKNNLVTFNDNGHPYLLKFLNPYAEGYYLENGGDKIATDKKRQAVYPYTNGDGSLFIYGTEMNEEQMGGGANTRPRWIWYFTNPTGYTDDPYHVTIHSRSTISYNEVSHPTYLKTEAVHFNQDADPNTKHIVTRGDLPGITSANPTEYMILGTQGNYRLVTTDMIDGARRTVNTLEQYWKTYNIVKQDVLGIMTNTEPDIYVVPDDQRTTLLERKPEWHSYEVYAYAVRWNGGSKIAEKLEHWFQTFGMGNGAFDIEDANIPPVLVLLDRHGWEIMRKPLPTTTYPYGDELEALRAYDSPMVKEYHFFNNATKASGCHKYTLRTRNNALRDEIEVSDTPYTSTSLAALPPLTASGVKDANGIFQDFYVTYTVKEEYEKSYDASTGDGSKFMVLQNGRYYKNENESSDKNKPAYISKPIGEHTSPANGSVYDAILDPHNSATINYFVDNGKINNKCLWYVKPNSDIDTEMGYPGTTPETYNPTATDWRSNGFDPYNLQFENIGENKFLTMKLTSTTLSDGSYNGHYDGVGGSTDVVLEAAATSFVSGEGHDHTTLAITNQTFMAVSDANGNMQLMPRFDHTKRVNLEKESPWYSTLKDPVDHDLASVDNNNSMGPQTTFLVRPQVQEYIITDNDGREALRYKRAGEYYPTITEHFKSPIAKDFTYYSGLAEHGDVTVISVTEWEGKAAEFKRTATTEALMNTRINLLPTSGTYYYQIGTRGSFTYKKVEVTKGLEEQKIDGSFAAAGLNDDNETIYVRYKYDEGIDSDGDNILGGKWFTVKLADKDLQADGTIVYENGSTQGTGVNLYTGTKPGTINKDAKVWQWKFLAVLADPSSDYYEEPDPYAVRIYNRSANYTTNPSLNPSPMNIGIKVPNTASGKDRFALLSHPDGGYALAVDGLGTYSYSFLNGADMTTPDDVSAVAATTATEAGFTTKNNVITAGAQLILNDDVDYNYVYHVINKAGTLAVSATQTKAEAAGNGYAPYLPEDAQTPLLNMEDYKYYAYAMPTYPPTNTTFSVIPYSIIATLAGGYDDVIWVRYNDYDAESTPYLVPNKRNANGSTIARAEGSNDVAMNIEGKLPYNIIWETDNMMRSSDGDAISDGGAQDLSGDQQYVWYFEGNDPYALKIKHKGGKYVKRDTGDADSDGNTDECSLENEATSFMLLKKTGYGYGILQETGGTNKLSEYGQTTTTGDPTKFIIFGLSVHDLIYHLIIAKTGDTVDIPYRDEDTPGTLGTTTITGTTQRDLTSKKDDDDANPVGSKYQLGETLSWGGANHTYSYDAGTVSIGDLLEVPGVFYRPNCTFDYYIEGVYSSDKNGEEDGLNAKYKGLKLKNLMSDADLIDKTVVVNVVYQFDTGVSTNTGLGFVTSVDRNLWYTMETVESGTPHLARYTSTGGLNTAAGRELHYTNDFLWTPLGDVYGFYMYNRYATKNLEHTDHVMTTSALSAGTAVTMGTAGANSIYELIAGAEEGTFRFHPVANTEATKVYVTKDGSGSLILASTSPSEWAYGLDIALMQPYYQGAGNIGGLNDAGKAAYETAMGKEQFKITDVQAVVYNDDNIVHFIPGYYRLHSQPGISGISPVRYASGYLHETEKTADDSNGGTGLPMHFYSRQGVLASFAGEDDGLGSGFTISNATRGDIPIAPTENDPSTIFYVDGSLTNNNTISNVTMSTQGLNVIGNKMGEETATTYRLIDIGGGIVVLVNPDDENKYFNFTQTGNNYDLKYSVADGARIDDVKWCMEPANNLGLKVTMNDGGDDYYYATFYAPFDVLLPADDKYNAFTCSTWKDTGLTMDKVPAVGDTYAAGKFVPANTPVVIRTNDNSGSISLTLPSTTPAKTPVSCVFSGEYLEKMLVVDASHDVYTFGLPFTSNVTIDRSNGNITAPAVEQAETGVGFYINANPNKEHDTSQSLWQRNNRYVMHNKIYYRATGSGSGAREESMRGIQFVPVYFGDEVGEEQPGEEGENPSEGVAFQGDGCIYDMMGRKVATRQQVEDGSWRLLRPGIYIMNGKKFRH